MSEISKAVGQWIVENVGWTVIIFLFILSGLFKLTKIELNPIGWIIGWIGKNLTKDVRKDVADLKTETNKKFEEVKIDRAAKITELKNDYNAQIQTLKEDIDSFEQRTNQSLDEVKNGTTKNCEMLKKRMDQLEKSNDLQSVRQIRGHILDFANSCMNGGKHTQKDFDNIFEEDKEYKKFVKKYKIVNARYKEDFEFIVKCYHKCQEENSFLKESTSDA